MKQRPELHRPDRATPPGETLREVIEELGISQTDLANRTNFSKKHVNQIILGLAAITPETALALERTTGVQASFWNRLETRYRETLLRIQSAEVTAEEKSWLHSMPVKELAKRGYLPNGDPSSLKEAVLSFFGVNSLPAWQNIWQSPVASFKRTSTFKSNAAATAAWLRIGELKAAEQPVEPFSKAAFKNAVTAARTLSRQADALVALQELCAAAGVVVVYEPEITGCRASGATRWLSPSRALIQLSDRYKKDDHFWFSFFHEAGHVLLHSKKETFIDYGSDDGATEEEANRFATSTLIPPRDARQLPTLSTPHDVEVFAAKIGISPGIVVGQLEHGGLWPYSRGHSLKQPIRFH